LKRFVTAVFAAICLAACTKEAEPAKESKEGLEQAMKGVEQAEEGFKRMRERGEVLQQKVDEQTKILDSTIAKHRSVLTTRLSTIEASATRLSAERQTALAPLLAEAKQHLKSVEDNFAEHRAAPPDKTEESSRKLKDYLEKLDAACAQLEGKVREPEAS
jgi:hypothetical protein